ncbi:MAG: carboxypeptidase regulatory-like domain-containing protein [Acidobacteriota bacterium]|nr:carboxypeptidase regulatory-like domain-containing protein [Acidobacteriota bacterium]
MYSFIFSGKNLFKPILIALSAFFVSPVFAAETNTKIVVKQSGNPGVIKGIVRDEGGKPIADATVAIFRVGTSKLLKQVTSASDGSFLAKILPGTYTILAVAQGFNPVTLSEVEVNRSTELTYGFKLERSGSGNTLPEKRVDRNNPKWRIQTAQSRRSIYQNQEGDVPVDENKIGDTANAENTIEQTTAIAADEETAIRAGQTVVETYFADSGEGAYTGINFARLQSLSENAEIIFAGQIGTSDSAAQRFETNLKFRPNDNHQIRLNTSFTKLGAVKFGDRKKSLGQISFQALDEWKTGNGVILVFGLDYSRFLGASDDFSISPRLGLQYDINSRTRFRSAYTTPQEQSWQRGIELEDTQVIFREPLSVEDLAVEDGKPQMNKSSRFEFGVERVLDNKSSVEANVFFDATSGRGVGLANLPFTSLDGENFDDFVANQQGNARGIRFVYSRRLNGTFSASAGYAFGRGQKLSDKIVSNPANVFEDAYFQTFVGQFNADLKTGTQVKTIFRLSPQATVFAIDPFAGRLAIYDPSLSVLVTQSLPNWGLPIRAQAIIDARNLFDFQTNINNEEGSLRLNSQQRTLRGGIMLRF